MSSNSNFACEIEGDNIVFVNFNWEQETQINNFIRNYKVMVFKFEDKIFDIKYSAVQINIDKA